jgi:hypothetical protein
MPLTLSRRGPETVTFKKVVNAAVTFGDRSSIGHQPAQYAVLVDGQRVGLITGEEQTYMSSPRWNYWADDDCRQGLLAFNAVKKIGGEPYPVEIRHKVFKSFKAAKQYIVANIINLEIEMTDKTLGERLVDEADQAIKEQYLKRAAKQLQNAAANLSIAADHSTLGHMNRERLLWDLVQTVANLVSHGGGTYMPQLQSRVEDLQAFILNEV